MSDAAAKFREQPGIQPFVLGASKERAPTQVTTIAAGTEISGDIRSDNDLVIAGVVHGTITGSSSVTVAAGGLLKGLLKAKQATIAGVVVGDIAVEESLTLMAGSRVEGDLETCQLAVEPGAVIAGRCSMPIQAGSVAVEVKP